jgi:cytochrome c551/c552
LRLKWVFAFAFLFLSPVENTNVKAQDQDRLVSGPGSTLTENKCKICHELQHIRRSKLTRDQWSDNLRNMKERGTPMDEAEMAVILEYLAAYYSDRPAPPPAPDTLAGGGDPVEKLLAANACSGCHALDKRVVGPSFKEISAKYSGDAAAAARLAARMRAGSSGAWGAVPMPPNPGLGEADAATLAGWILQQK